MEEGEREKSDTKVLCLSFFTNTYREIVGKKQVKKYNGKEMKSKINYHLHRHHRHVCRDVLNHLLNMGDSQVYQQHTSVPLGYQS